MDLDSLEDDTPFIVEDDEDEEVHAKLLALPGQVSSITAQLSKLKVMDALPILLIKATEALNRFGKCVIASDIRQKMVILVFSFQQAKLALSCWGSETILMIEEQLENQNKVEQNIKVDMAKKEVELGRE
ncbi:hypothetical protein Tco_1149255 [Tanacetum coccineum]